jgi:hypothetical protein
MTMVKLRDSSGLTLVVVEERRPDPGRAADAMMNVTATKRIRVAINETSSLVTKERGTLPCQDG